jgi:hypothetical protein
VGWLVGRSVGSMRGVVGRSVGSMGEGWSVGRAERRSIHVPCEHAAINGYRCNICIITGITFFNQQNSDLMVTSFMMSTHCHRPRGSHHLWCRRLCSLCHRTPCPPMLHSPLPEPCTSLAWVWLVWLVWLAWLAWLVWLAWWSLRQLRLKMRKSRSLHLHLQNQSWLFQSRWMLYASCSVPKHPQPPLWQHPPRKTPRLQSLLAD